ncbi:unnamed protein product [Mycena citricolor]|uniref:Cell wall mannoprotein n=1 Tax=Mycena citricolor TaxID=2018698 RepID=A0AAD2K836_9AGAR|nr:unnamed protein product [Mycena citricolor]
MLSVKSVFLALLLSSTSLAAPIRREVPQEHSHEPFLTSVRASLNLNNPDKIQDPVFALLGDAAASAGKGNIADVTCLQQATADQAFTNAKAKGDIQGMTDALIYRALERNSGSVGAVSKTCTSLKATNPEIAAVQQHQDPASTNAAAGNKAIVLELAKQIASIGGDPQQALKSGTFKAGTIGDPTAKGNSCDDANDANGCIFTQNLLVEDATAAEISAAVAGVAAATGAAAAAATSAAAAATTVAAAAGATDTCPPQSTVTVTVQPTAAAAAATDATAASTAALAVSTGTSGSFGNFGSCPLPLIKFGVGFDNRKETSFEPQDQTAYAHGSAQAVGIIEQFMCDNLVNKCGADATAKATCASAKTAALALCP